MALLLSPMAHARRLLAPRLARVSPFDYGNPLAEARSLNRAGYHAASVMLARIAVEKQLKAVVGAHPKWTGKRRRNFDEMMRFCHLQGVVNRACYKHCRNFQKQANSVVHGNPVDRARAWFIIRRAATIVSMLSGGAA
jgi:hypothetical protein